MQKPDVTVSPGPPPADLVVQDLIEGSGAEATPGRSVTVHYVGVHQHDGSQFDASWDRGEPLSFALGGGMVIAGWDRGVAGMRVGGRRQLVIPAHLGYGSQGYPPVIQPDETLVFVVDLLDVT
jgi:peptidylprolyl isomerase